MNPRESLLRRVGRCLGWGVLGIAVGTIALLYIQGASGPPLKPWHTAELDAEFTADRADDIDSLEAYLRLEEELFAQLEEEVYAQTATGPEYELVRYRTGSAADPRRRRPDWNRSFELVTEVPVGGVLLLHGMSDSPYSLRELGETLHRAGFQVLGLRLPGHGTAPSGLRHVTWQDMAAAVRVGMRHLAKTVGQKPIHVVGYSTGAPLALDFALDARDGNAKPMPASMVLISPAIGVSPAAALAKWKRRLSYLPGLGRLAWLQIVPEFDPFKYNSFATNAGEQVHRLTRSVNRRIANPDRDNPTVSLPPILVFKSTVDATVSTGAVVDNLLARLEPDRHELVLFDINRFETQSPLLVSDPAPLTARVMDDPRLPFAATLITNANLDSNAVVARHKPPFSAEVSRTEPLDHAWPRAAISLSHVALPFPPDDPLYGQRPEDNDDVLFLGQMAIQGERGLLKFPADWLLRLRHNPFYDYLERRVLDWVSDSTVPRD